jgi:hypothetical protein
LGNNPDSITKRKSKIVGIQAFQTPISNAGISDMIHLLIGYRPPAPEAIMPVIIPMGLT